MIGTIAMNAPMQAEPVSTQRWPRLLLIVFALITALSALSDLGGIAMNLADNPAPGAASWLLWSAVPIKIVLALAALVFAIKGQVPRAIIAMALMPLVTLLVDVLPSIITHGPDLAGAGGIITIVQLVVLPGLSLMAIQFARRNERLGLATFLVILPALLGAAMIAAFAIGVAIYGF